tara:strand:+ start:324 stop:578 length:255 start_codon:yes stop_codon:yes gene_type:complete
MLCDLLDYLSTCSWCEAEAEDEEDEEEEEEEEEGCDLSQNFPRTVDLLACSKGRHPKILIRKVATHIQLVCISRKKKSLWTRSK